VGVEDGAEMLVMLKAVAEVLAVGFQPGVVVDEAGAVVAAWGRWRGRLGSRRFVFGCGGLGHAKLREWIHLL
jgi:hypothetical protein